MKNHCSETLGSDTKPVNLVDSDETLDKSNKSGELYMEEEELDASPVRAYTRYFQSRWAQPWGKVTHPKPLYTQQTAPKPPSPQQAAAKPNDDEPSPQADAKPKDDEPSPSDWTQQAANEPSPFDWTDGSPENKELAPLEPKWNFSHIDEEPKSMLGAGLSNLGNTCFLNAVLQSFMHTVSLIQGLKSSDHATPCDGYLKGFCVICALRKLIDASLFSEAGVVSPWKFVNNLNYFSSTFRRFQQEDAHEFLQCFLDKLERCCDDSRPKDCPILEADNIVKQAFGGRLVSKLWCCNCGHSSDTFEPLIDLSLEIEDVDSLDTALESFTKVEKIEDSEIKFTCEKCKEQVSIEKQLVLDKAPSVAALHLKRFKTDGSLVEKIDKYVSFPLELDLHTYADNNQIDNEELKYDLYAVIVHIGFSYSSGHYYSFIRSAPNEWYKFDDSKVVRVREDYVLSQEAYVLFYAKRGTPWFSDFIDGLKPFIDPSIWNTSPKSVLENTDAVSETSPRLPSAQAFCVKESNDAANESSPNSLKKVQDSKGKENMQMMSASRPPLRASNILDSKSPELDKVSLPSVLKENRSALDPVSTSRTLYITPETPPRSPSPEIYREDPPDNDYHIPRGHLRTAGQVSCKKQLQKELEQDMERKQACSLIKKNMRGSRAQQLLSAMRGSQSEGSATKRRRRMEVSPTRDDSNSTSRRRSSFGSTLRTVMAGSMR
ncbi:ubiquitin carboxyl-terminal hydrolase 20-like [Lycium barbarum]|uniref:ubiquitin carboxyl-terminal hydrolase 20-like n=1 Tax=Lycium barbarum TaxID=112863 RepID=UPI00293ECBC2|nr:ubiquitin carboxyl-terminal hydrolase 20-like [Lycium barbarum]